MTLRRVAVLVACPLLALAAVVVAVRAYWVINAMRNPT